MKQCMPSLATTFVLVATTAACQKNESDLAQPSDEGSVAIVGADAASVGDKRSDGDTDEEPIPAAAQIQLPAGWAGEGVLAKRHEDRPKNAPEWTSVAAEVVREEGKRLLRTTGKASRIKNRSLLRNTADARARAEMTRWVASTELRGGLPVDHWFDPKSGTMYTRMQLSVPDEWVPGAPLPKDDSALPD